MDPDEEKMITSCATTIAAMTAFSRLSSIPEEDT
jgi:hypothetical protein